MQPESLVQLIASGNSTTVEKEWMQLVGSHHVPLAKLPEYAPVLEALCKVDKQGVAGEYAWSALEALSAEHKPDALLSVAGPFLLAVGDHEELRAQVADLYRKAYSDVDGLEDLIQEAGLVAGRPVRRALRTLEVCLPRKEGDYLAARHDGGAARISAIDRGAWQFTIDDGERVKTLDAVPLADAYAPAPPSDFQVLRRFAPKRLLERLQEEPAAVVIDLCKRNGSKITSARLEEILVPEFFSEAEWKKWWSAARAALRKIPNVNLEGRAPYTISYLEVPIKLEETLWNLLKKARDPVKQLGVVEDYLKECKASASTPSNEALRRCHELLSQAAAKALSARAGGAIVRCAVAARAGTLAEVSDAGRELKTLLGSTDDPGAVFSRLHSEALVDVVCSALPQARPADWQEILLEHLPMLPQGSCDRAAAQLIQAGRSQEDFYPAITRILAAPLDHFSALLWLWDGAGNLEMPANAQPVSILVRALRALEDARLSDSVSSHRLAEMKSSARSCLSARRYERFEACLDGMDRAMAAAVKTQLRRSDALGRAVGEDLFKRLVGRFPAESTKAELAPWDQEGVLFVTSAGFRRKKDEITEHVNVKMAANSRAIGRAAEHGDLSENSEYKFALEERDLLRARLAQMNEEAAQAQLIDPAKVPTDQIGIGTRVVFKRTTDGQRYEMTFYGPWEADAERGIFNYLAPLAKSLMGKRIGDVVNFAHTGAEGSYEIIELHNSLTESEHP